MKYKYSDCTGVTSITIPNSVTSIAPSAFSGCRNLKDVYCYAETVPEASNAFGYYAKDANLHVPSSSIADYRKAKGWSDFGIIGGSVFEWVDLIENGDMEAESEFTYFYSKEMEVDNGAYKKSRVVEGAGFNGTKGIEVSSYGKYSNTWDNQFYICLPYSLPSGTPIQVELDNKAGTNGRIYTCGHSIMGTYWGEGIGWVPMDTEWKHYQYSGITRKDTWYGEGDSLNYIVFDLNNEIFQGTVFYFDNISVKILKDDLDALRKQSSPEDVEIVPMEENTEIAFDESITEETDLTNVVIDNVYVTLDTNGADGYDTTEKCVVLASTVTEKMLTTIADKEVGDEEVKKNFNGLIMEVPAGKGTISIHAQTKGCRALNVKIGDAEAQTFVQPERGEIKIPYIADKDTYVYIYGGEMENTAKRMISGGSTDNGVLIYGIKWEASVPSYSLAYKVDDKEYKTVDVEYGAAITAETEPTKEGYTFSGWSEIPATMPAKDVTVTGSFVINKYKLIYKVDDEEYKSIDVEYGATITPEADPMKEGYTFSGWSLIPETMPAKDVTVTGSFTFVDAIDNVIADDGSYEVYTLDGKQVEALQKGVNIIKYKNGSTQKVFVK